MSKINWLRILMACGGGVVLSLLDRLQILTGVISYKDALFGPLLRAIIQFCGFYILLSILVPLLDHLFKDRQESGLIEVLLEFVYFAIIYSLTCLFQESSIGLAVLFLGILLGKYFIFGEKGDWKYIILLGLLGPTTESLLTHFGMFAYRSQDFFGIPFWLPMLWANGGFLTRRLFSNERFEGISIKENTNG